jgi:hypothetical protein
MTEYVWIRIFVLVERLTLAIICYYALKLAVEKFDELTGTFDPKTRLMNFAARTHRQLSS